MEPISTLPKVLALTSLALLVISSVSVAKPKDYENFDLPKKASKVPTEAEGFNFSSSRVTMKGRGVKLDRPSVTTQQFLFAKEAYISEKRDEAIRLLRQQMDSGLKANRDNMLLKLGQLYAEKYMELSYRENEVYSQQLAKKDKGAKLDQSRSKRYLNDALGLFYKLEKEYPQHPKRDEIYYFIGFVEAESGKQAKGAKYLEKVVKEFPRSRKFEEAAVYLGDYYFEKHKFRDARDRYALIMRRSEASLKDYAGYKIAWCDLNTGSQQKALNDMKALVDRLAGTADQSKFSLRDQALKDLVIFYADVGSVEDAKSYFTRVQGQEKAMENLKLLADFYRTKARDDAAIKAYNIIIPASEESPELPKMYLGLFDSQARISKGDAAIKTMLAAVEKFHPDSDWANRASDKDAAEAKSGMDAVAVEAEKVAFFHHHAGQKSANAKHYEYALRLYESLLKNFPNHPNRKKLAFFQGEAFFIQNHWLKAADSYMIAAKTPPKDKLADESVYNALLALDKLTAKSDKLARHSKEEQEKVDTTPQDIPASEKRFIEVAEYYLSEYPTGDKVVDVRFRIASIYYRFHHFDEAQSTFKDIALKHPKHRSATVAAHIVLDIYNIKKDYDGLVKTATVFTGVKELGDPEFRTEIAKITGEIDFKRIEAMEAKGEWKEAGDAYSAYYKKNPSSNLAEKSLYNAYVSYDKASESGMAADTAKLFLAKFPKSEYSKTFILKLARSAEQQYDFELAQKQYHEFYKRFPEDKEAKKALYNAAVFAELLEYNQQALNLYDEYVKKGKVSQEEQKAIQISQAKLQRKLGNWDGMAKIYRRLMREARSEGEKLAYLGELARQYERAGKMAERKATMDEIRWKFDPKHSKDSGFAAQYAAEAQFGLIAKDRAKYEELRPRFPPQDLIFMLKKKQKALVKLADKYDTVIAMGVPDWGVAALLEKAEAYENFVKSYRNVAIPKKYQGEERAEAEKALKQIDDQMVAPLESKMKEYVKVCVDKASEFHVTNEYSTKCQEKLDGQSGTTMGLIPQPNYWNTRISGGVAKK